MCTSTSESLTKPLSSHILLLMGSFYCEKALLTAYNTPTCVVITKTLYSIELLSKSFLEVKEVLNSGFF